MNDYSALAQRVSMSVTGVRGCLMLSRDGMVLGAHPEGEQESHLRSSWVRFAAVGDPERSYVEFPDQVWAFVRRGGYSAFAVADTGVRPGVLVDLLEQALMIGEQHRALDRETTWLHEAPAAPSGKPRTSLHKPERPPAAALSASRVELSVAPEVGTSAVIHAGAGPSEAGSDAGPTQPDGPAPEPEPVTEPEPEREVEVDVEAEETPSGPEPEVPPGRGEDDPEVDRILLAKEFAGLLQVPREDDEAST